MFLLRNKKITFQLRTLIWWPDWRILAILMSKLSEDPEFAFSDEKQEADPKHNNPVEIRECSPLPMSCIESQEVTKDKTFSS